MDARVRALQSVLAQKGYVDPAALDVLIDTYQTKIGPRNGARVVARAWIDPAFRDWLLARRERGDRVARLHRPAGRAHDRRREHAETRHNLVVCTLCSCYPWPVLGLPPTWYKSAPYRSRAVKDPRGVLAEFGVSLPESTEIRVWDSTAEVRYLVVPRRPAGSRRLERRRARRARHPRFDDRNRIAARSRGARDDVHVARRSRRRGRAWPRRPGTRSACSFMRRGNRRRSR